MIDAGKSVRYTRLFLLARQDCCSRMEEAYICAGNDSTDPEAVGNVCTSFPIYDGGFINIEELPEAQYLYIFRAVGTNDYRLNFSVARAFQSPNLLENGTEIIHNYSPVSGEEASNLI